ncbi:MAG: protein tlpB [Flavobacteriales bacterium]|nr:protein tlpB [Flavobacteriales bacterium]|tara:strand:+ start:62504 stop:63484 length:981 start_codon:yes stop_codon:yes gene_type:complete
MKDLIEKISNSLVFVWFLRVLISALFFVSAVAKMYPNPEIGLIKYFEIKQLVQGLGFNEILAQYFSRSIIAFEFFIAISVLLNNYLKRVIYPISILLLVAFTTHLAYIAIQGNDGNCGCFGELIPMTPIEAIIKNIITILILYFLYSKTSKNLSSSFRSLVILMLSCLLFMFIYVPLRSNKKIQENTTTTFNQVTSLYSQYISQTDIDRGEKILCFFAPGCDHCQSAAKQIKELQNQIDDFPEVYVVFLDEEPEKIPDFLKKAGADFKYEIMDIYNFMEVFLIEYDTPGIVYLNNGNVLEFYQGTKDSGSSKYFTPEALKKILENR